MQAGMEESVGSTMVAAQALEISCKLEPVPRPGRADAAAVQAVLGTAAPAAAAIVLLA